MSRSISVRRRIDPSALPLGALGIVLVLFLGLPLLGLALNLSGKDLNAVYSDPQTRQAVLTSLITASVSTVLAGCLGVPLAYLLARFRFPGRSLVNALVFLPLVLPPISAGILLILVYGPYGMIGALLAPRGLTVVDTAAGIVVAQVFVSSPFVVVSARAAFERIDAEYEEAAAVMGASLWQVFLLVALPMARGGIAAGLTLGWMRAIGEFGATVILAYHPYSLPVLNYVGFNSVGLSVALPLALLACIIAGAVLLVLGALGSLEWGDRLSRP